MRKSFEDSIITPRELKMLKYRGYCEAHINKFYVLLAVNNFLTHPAVTGGFSSLACSRINFGRVILPCFKWAPLNHSSPLATDSAWQSALARSLGQHSFSPISSSVARQAAFNYAMLLCRRCIYVVHGSFLYIIYSAHILAARPYVLRAHLYVYI